VRNFLLVSSCVAAIIASMQPYSLKAASFQTMPEFLLASEYW
jgi:hypothetical protein